MPLELALYHERLDRAQAALFAALADPVHVQVVHALAGRSLTARQLERLTGRDEAVIDAALGALAAAGVVVASSAWPPPLYSLRDAGLAAPLRALRHVASQQAR